MEYHNYLDINILTFILIFSKLIYGEPLETSQLEVLDRLLH